METQHGRMRRRDFLKTCVAAAGLSAVQPSSRAAASTEGARQTAGAADQIGEDAMDKTVLSFFCDDTSAHRGPPDTFGRFLDYVKSEGIAGESSVIIGLGSSLLSEPHSDAQRIYIEHLHRAFECGIDAHMELMTHGRKFDFKERRFPESGIHEGLWLHEPDVPVEEYEAYFDAIIAEGEKIGVRFTGLTWPGGGGPETARRYGELRKLGIANLSPNCWQALLNLAKRGRFRGRTVPCFVRARNEVGLMAADGAYGVYDIPVIGQDWLGRWDNSPNRVNPDYYITADGQGGNIVEWVRAGRPYCFFHAHWQGLNPANGVGWEPFKLVVQRIKEHLGDRVVWMRPSQFTDYWHDPQRADRNA